MFGFLIKKAFFDLWDNFLPAILLNLGFVGVLALPILVPPAFSGIGTVASLIALIIGILAVFVYAGGAVGLAKAITNYESLEWAAFFATLRSHAPLSMVLGVLVILHIGLLLVAMPVYTAMNNMVGLFAIAVLFWMSVIWWLGIQYVLPVGSRLPSSIAATFKKSFILTLDNTFFTVALGLGAGVIVLLSFFTAFLIPGIAGVAIWYQAALKLRLYKYDYLEENSAASRKDIPWDALLYDDRERVGKRTLRGMIFPWKE